jgi:hypothetical protein
MNSQRSYSITLWFTVIVGPKRDNYSLSKLISTETLSLRTFYVIFTVNCTQLLLILLVTGRIKYPDPYHPKVPPPINLRGLSDQRTSRSEMRNAGRRIYIAEGHTHLVYCFYNHLTVTLQLPRIGHWTTPLSVSDENAFEVR